ncbi:MAG: hypothetical protein KC486_01965 [Myxococcales bacterium]|nr:hypothetical protein [Myxococcales bacterium]
MGVDAERSSHRRLEEYVGALPRGLDSFPECQIKAGFCRELLAALPRAPAGLPAPLADLVAAPPPISSWIPEVHHQALVEAIVDEFYDSRDAYLEVAYACQRRLFSTRIYAPLLQLVSPERLLRQAAKRWGNFHRGTSLEVLEEGDHVAQLRVLHPPRLFTRTGLRSLGSGFRAAVDASRAQTCAVEICARHLGSTTFEIRWS